MISHSFDKCLVIKLPLDATCHMHIFDKQLFFELLLIFMYFESHLRFHQHVGLYIGCYSAEL